MKDGIEGPSAEAQWPPSHSRTDDEFKSARFTAIDINFR
jgi:hypothetical protein